MPGLSKASAVGRVQRMASATPCWLPLTLPCSHRLRRQLLDRARHTTVIAAIAGGEQSGLLALLIHRAVASLTGGAVGGLVAPRVWACACLPCPVRDRRARSG